MLPTTPANLATGRTLPAPVLDQAVAARVHYSLAIPKMALSVGFIRFVSSTDATQS
jgi:hypothetical protein